VTGPHDHDTKETNVTELGFSIQEVVIATRDAGAAAERFGKALGAEVDERVSYPQDGIGIDMTGVWVGDFRLAFVEDTTGTGHVARSIEKRGEGLFELCLRTDDLAAAMEHMKANGLRFTSDEPHILENYEWRGEIWSEVHVAFVHPATSFGTQIEVQQWVR
jgi:methylmalonyl-CoA/ethylmalonyl-CoA epimerase